MQMAILPTDSLPNCSVEFISSNADNRISFVQEDYAKYRNIA